MKRGRLAVLEAIAFFAWDDGDGGGRTDLKTVRQIATRAKYGWRATHGHITALKADKWIRSEGRIGHPKGCRYVLDAATLAGLSTMTGAETPAAEPPAEAPGDPCRTGAEPMQNPPEPMQNLPTKSLTSETDKEETGEDAREGAASGTG